MKNSRSDIHSKAIMKVALWIKYTMACAFILTCTVRCVPVKGYQKNKINDAEMSLSNREVEKFESTFYLYREGAGGANGGKSGGGCGCN